MIPTRPHACVVCGSDEHVVVATGTDYQYATTHQEFRWCKCQCGHHYIDPLPTETALPTLYPDTLKNYADFDAKPGVAFRVKALLEGRQVNKIAAKIPEGGRFLDVGCAAGMFLDVVKKNCPNIRELEGLEISPAAAKRCVEKGYKVYIGTVDHAPLPDESYDLISMQQVIEHMHDPRASLTRLRSLLRPGGQVIIETPNLGSWDHALFNNGYWEGYHIPRHFNLWTCEGMIQMLRQVGFSKVTYKKRIKPVHWTASLQNWAIGTKKPKSVVRFFDLQNPLGLALFGILDVLQLSLFGKASDIQYVATR